MRMLMRVESTNDQVGGENQDVALNETKDHERCDVGKLGTLGSVTQSENELEHNEGQVEVLKQGVDNRSTRVTERPSVTTRCSVRSTHEIHDDGSCKPVRTEREPSEECVESRVDELNVKEEHADDVVTGLVHTTEVHQRVQSSGERTVEPSSTLTDEFSRSFRHIGFTLSSLDVRQMPLLTSLGDQLETQNTILGQEHVLLENVHTIDTLLTKHLRQGMITMEILLQRTSHNGSESRLVENIGDLVLKVLDSNEGVEQLLAALTQHGVNFTTSTTEILVVVETLPKSKERSGTGLGTGIEQDTHLRVQDTTESVEEPSMRVDLLGVLLLQTEDHLNWWQVLGAFVCGSDKLLVGGDGKLGGVFKDMSNGLLAVDILLDNTVLVNTNSRKDIEGVLVSLIDTVENQAHNDLLPSRPTLVPECRLLEVDDIADVLHGVMQGSGKQNLIFVIVCNGNQQLSVSVIHARSQIVTVLECEVVGITSGSGVSHLMELLSATLGIAILGLDSVLDSAGNGVINAEDGALNKLDLSGF
ncbi:hypothetical protein HG530_013537 [Fusarium avenaceum]|nr:hypothetical protein HG530_013537 [Fusarium avenaceum]